MNILQVGLRGDIRIDENGSFSTTPRVSTGNNVPQNLKWPSRDKHQQIISKIASKKLHSRASKISPQAVSHTVSGISSYRIILALLKGICICFLNDALKQKTQVTCFLDSLKKLVISRNQRMRTEVRRMQIVQGQIQSSPISQTKPFPR